MARGIEWFRWHHGSVTDPKFQLIARQCGVRLGDVIATWAFILESSSANTDRGVVEKIDHETLDFLLGVDGGTSARIVEAMTIRGLIEGGRVAAWERRQPKREDDDAAERKRRQRERDEAFALRDEKSVTQDHNKSDESRRVTTSHARGEERREEGIPTPPSPPVGAEAVSAAPEPDGFAEWWELYRRKDAKADALKAWRQLAPSAELRQRMLAALRVWRWNSDRRLNPMPATWIRGRRWEDELVSKAIGMSAAKSPDWCQAAGFDNVYEAANAGCYAHNADQFEAGRRRVPA